MRRRAALRRADPEAAGPGCQGVTERAIARGPQHGGGPLVVRALLFALLATTGRAALAVDPSEYLVSPIVTEGERELDWQFGAGSPGRQTQSRTNSGIGLGFGVNDHWFTEFSLDVQKVSGKPTKPDEFEWDNVLQMAQQNEWPVDVGLDFSVAKEITGPKGLSVRFGPLFQKEFGRAQANLNLLFVRHFGRGPRAATEVRYQAQVKYRYSEPFEFGLQAFGHPGSIGHSWVRGSQPVHRLGPVALGRIALLRERAVSYNAALLFGATPHSPDCTLRVQIEYEF